MCSFSSRTEVQKSCNILSEYILQQQNESLKKKKIKKPTAKNPEAPAVLNVVEVFLLRTTVMPSKQNTVNSYPNNASSYCLTGQLLVKNFYPLSTTFLNLLKLLGVPWHHATAVNLAQRRQMWVLEKWAFLQCLIGCEWVLLSRCVWPVQGDDELFSSRITTSR